MFQVDSFLLGLLSDWDCPQRRLLCDADKGDPVRIWQAADSAPAVRTPSSSCTLAQLDLFWEPKTWRVRSFRASKSNRE